MIYISDRQNLHSMTETIVYSTNFNITLLQG